MKEILSRLYRIAIIRNIPDLTTKVLKICARFQTIRLKKVKITSFGATRCYIPYIREFTPLLHVTQGGKQSLPTVFPVKWIYITMRLQLD